MNPPLFRKEAMERLSSPDQLDQLMVVTTTRGWLALAALGIVLLAGIAWGLFGSVSTRVASEGMFFLQGSVSAVYSQSAGRIERLDLETEQMVEAGQVVAVIDSPAWRERINLMTYRMDERRRQQATEWDERRKAFEIVREMNDLQRRNIEAGLAEARIALAEARRLGETRRETLDRRRQDLDIQVAMLEQREANQRNLFEQQLVRRQDLNATQVQLLAARDEARRLALEIEHVANEQRERAEVFEERQRQSETERARLAAEERQREAELAELAAGHAAEVRMIEGELESAKEEARATTVIVSPHAGRVLFVECAPGDLVEAGRRLAVIGASEGVAETAHDVVAFVSAAEGKRIEAGMEAQVVPVTVKAEEYGVMRGRVHSVSRYPVSRQAVQNVVANPDLAETFLRGGPPFKVWIDLEDDPATPSGFRWSSSKGPPHGIGRGTLCTVQVVVRRQPPLSLVIPWVRSLLFGQRSSGGAYDG